MRGECRRVTDEEADDGEQAETIEEKKIKENETARARNNNNKLNRGAEKKKTQIHIHIKLHVHTPMLICINLYMPLCSHRCMYM